MDKSYMRETYLEKAYEESLRKIISLEQWEIYRVDYKDIKAFYSEEGIQGLCRAIEYACNNGYLELISIGFDDNFKESDRTYMRL